MKWLLTILGAAQFQTAPVQPRPLTIADQLIATYAPLVGLRETPLGSNRGPKIDEFNRSASTSLGAPWCAAVAHWGQTRNGLPGRGAYSPSWFKKDVVVARNRVQPGDMALVWYASKGRYAHTIACIEAVKGERVLTLEGNTGDGGEREGDGFYRRLRRIDSLTFVRWRN